MLFMAYKYGGDVEAALLSNANAGGENVHRGILLGALFGAAYGASKIPKRFKSGLYDSASIAWDIDAFVAVLCSSSMPEGERPDRKISSSLLPHQTAKKTSSKKSSVAPLRRDAQNSSPAGGQSQQVVPALPREDSTPLAPPPARCVSLLRS